MGRTDGSVIVRPGHLAGAIARGDDPADRRKTRRLEWVGVASPFDHPVVQFRYLTGAYTPTQQKALRLMAARANTRAGGNRNRLLEHDHPAALAPVKGLSTTYHWTAANGYVQDVAYRDADVILSTAVAHEFVDLDALADGQPTPGPTPADGSRVWEREFVGEEVGVGMAR